jgi:hypothetical protein
MKLVIRAAVMAAAISMCFANVSFAQVSSDGMGKILPVELYVCNFKDGKDAGDLDRVIDRWNRYMDDNDADYYSAWTLTPYYYGPAQNVDFIWMGAFRDANAMGADTDRWLAEGGDLQEAFGDVEECATHIGLNSAMYKAPPGNETPQSSIIAIMDCKLNEGHRYSDIRSAEIKWAEHLDGVGSTAGIWHWFPRFGGGTAEYDYKVVSAYANFTDMGVDLERRANGGDFQVSRDIFGDIDECDDARVYVAQNRRAAQLR